MTTFQTVTPNLRLALLWAILGALGSLAILPYAMALNPLPAGQIPFPLPVLALISTLQSGLLLFALSWLGLHLGQRIGLDSPFARALVYRLERPAVSKQAVRLTLVSGLLGGAIIWEMAFLFQPLLPPTPQTLEIAFWKRVLASFYGGITEELLLRLFLMTLLVWSFCKLGLKQQEHPSRSAVWIAIVLAALLFGVAHLPAAAAIWPLTSIVVVRTILLNTLPGLVFGFLYWRWGLEYAMFSHFCMDIVLHVIGGN